MIETIISQVATTLPESEYEIRMANNYREKQQARLKDIDTWNKLIEDLRYDAVPDFRRTSGESICGICGLKYFKHPHTSHAGYDEAHFLRRLCTGEIVKL